MLVKKNIFLQFAALVTCGLLVMSSNSTAQQNVDIFLRKYSQQDGLSSFFVHQVIQDKNGFLYVATQEGLDRFDGTQFIHYRKTNEEGYRLAGIDIRSTVEDTANNLLWVLPGENGANAINTITGKITKFIPVIKDNENEWNLTLFLDNQKLFIGTSVGVKVYDTKQGKFLNKLALYKINPNKSGGYQVRAINKDKNGNIWVCYSGYGIVIYNQQLSPTGFISNDELIGAGIKNDLIRLNGLLFIDKGKVLVATSKGLRKVMFTQTYQSIIVDKTPSSINDEINFFPVQSMCLSRDGRVYIAGSKHLYRFDTSLSRYDVIQEVIFENGNNWLANVLSIFEDEDNNIWLGCNQGLA
ncbi:MAG: hypothetical protein RIS73_1684, partial [Bacteroidota bacterium]